MDIVWGRQASWCHIIHYALFLSALHAGMINFLMYLSSHLVSYKPSNGIGLLQTKLRHREGHKARRIGLETMPLDQYVEGGHGERQTRLKILPASMHHLFEMADECQHREHRLHEHAVLPLAALTQFEVAGIALRGMEGGVAQDDHPPINLLNQPLKGVVRNIGGGTRPPH